MMNVAFANLKGGVGKSTTTLIAAETLAMSGKRVLVIDLDPQASSSFMLLGGDGLRVAETNGRTLPHFLMSVAGDGQRNSSDYIATGGSDLVEVQQSQTGRIDVLPSIPRMWFAEFDYSEKLFRQNKDPVEGFRIALLAALNMLYNHYDVVLLDCPPGFSVSTRAGLLIADAIVSPTLADEISMLSLADFTQLGIREILSERATDHHYVVVSRFDARLVEQRRMLGILERSYDVLKPPIRQSAHMATALYRSNSTSSRTLDQKYQRVAADVRLLGSEILRLIIEVGQR